MNKIIIYIITFYKKFISSFIPRSCRFYPSCSLYAIQAFKKHSFFMALKLSILRILRCHPFSSGGYDPVP